jgi:RNA polymerase sigma-70 factor (ECF subfamily)
VPNKPHAPLLAELFQEHAPYLWRAIRRLGVGDAEVDDLTQEVFLAAHRRLSEFEGRSSVRTWLYGICLRVVSDFRRRARVRREDLMAAPPDGGAAAGQIEELERQRNRALLDDALATLDDDQRAVVVLYEVEDLPLRKIAEITEAPLQTVYSRLKVARARVEEHFKQVYAAEAAPRRKEGNA